MACGCKKKKRPAPAPAPSPTGKGSTSTGGTASYALITNGRKLSYGSKLEADAANARQGYTGEVRKVRG